MQSVLKNYISINGNQLFYRSLGAGPAIILLHPSPRSSAMMEPLMQVLAPYFTVIAPDTPGYGLSEKSGATINTVNDYVYFIEALRNEFGVEKISLYGSASGAQLAIGYALKYPEKLTRLYLDNAAHFEEEVCNEILNNYFIDISPKEDGNHLTNLWNHVCNSCLFFPWYDVAEKNRIANQLPPSSVIQNIVNDYLLAGVDYALAYKAAFKNERANNVQSLITPTTIFRWMGSPILKHIDALLQHSMPSNIIVVETPNGVIDRLEEMRKHISMQ